MKPEWRWGVRVLEGKASTIMHLTTSLAVAKYANEEYEGGKGKIVLVRS